MARRPSSIDRLPPQIRELIGRLREGGRTIDEILAKLRELDVTISRTALARHTKEIDAIADEIRRSRGVAEAIVEQFGDKPDDRVSRLNIELMHGLLMRVLVGQDGQPVELDAKEAMFLSTALDKLAGAAKKGVESTLKIRQQAAKDAAAEVAKVAKAEGLSRDTIEKFRRHILGIAAQ